MPVAAFDGMAKVETTCPDVESELLLPLILVPEAKLTRVKLVIGAFAGGLGGEDSSVMVTVTVVPALALPPGAEEPTLKVVVPALSKVATAVRATR